MSATEVAKELNVPTVYVEEELEILTKGENGKYGFLRKLENGKFAINVILFDQNTIEKAHALYKEQIPQIAAVVTDYIEQNKNEYLAFPYLNRKVDLNLILWQQVTVIARAFSSQVNKILGDTYFKDIPKLQQEFSVYDTVLQHTF